ncbi:MAG: HD domain-containing protein [Spirochaetes bacterium]|nr:HD domain-containing protein [Spirochaetota bacterium]
MKYSRDYSILDGLLEGCQIISFDYRYVYVNDTVVRHGRKSRDELLGHSMEEAYPGIVTTPMFSLLKQCMDERKTVEMENEFTFSDGGTAWFALKMEPVPEGVFILSMDISERKQQEIELQNHLRRLEALRQIDIAIISTTNLSLALKTITEQVVNSLGVDSAAILLLDPHTQLLEFAAGRGFRTREMERAQLYLGQGCAGRAALNEELVLCPGLTEEPLTRSFLTSAEMFVSCCAVPLIAKGLVIGALEVFNRTPLHPDQKWKDFFLALGQQASIAIDSSRLFQNLKRSNMNLMLAYDMTIEGWSKALDLRDKETEGHTMRVTELTVAMARAAGMPESEIVHIRRGALLHDIGKMGVPDTILLKTEELTEDERAIMRKHPVYAYEMLSSIEYLKPSLSIPYSHHEKWDGTGYPQGLKGEQIPLAARLFAVVDVWDALLRDRRYRQGWPEEKVLEYIRSLAGTHFDPQAVELLMRVLRERSEQSEQG